MRVVFVQNVNAHPIGHSPTQKRTRPHGQGHLDATRVVQGRDLMRQARAETAKP